MVVVAQHGHRARTRGGAPEEGQSERRQLGVAQGVRAHGETVVVFEEAQGHLIARPQEMGLVAHGAQADDQVRQIADATGRANIIEGLERTEGSLTAAFDRGMEMTMWGTPELRSLAQAANADNVPGKKSTDRKSKQSALSGSCGSAPRTKPAQGPPKTRGELMERMLADVRAGVMD